MMAATSILDARAAPSPVATGAHAVDRGVRLIEEETAHAAATGVENARAVPATGTAGGPAVPAAGLVALAVDLAARAIERMEDPGRKEGRARPVRRCGRKEIALRRSWKDCGR